MFLGVIFAVVVVAGPIIYLLFTPTPLDPIGMFTRWSPDHLAWRIGGSAFYILLLCLFFAYAANRGAPNPFDELSASIRRIALRDFGVRLGPYKFKEPHEFNEVAEAFNAMAADLQRSEELRNSMMADVSHELRTPLTVLEGNLRAALDHVYALDEAEIANLYSQTTHLIRLVNDLHELALAEARQLPLDRQPTDLCGVVNETMQIFAPLAEERGVVLRCAVGELPMLCVDGSRMRQVLYNLLTNALRHTPHGGEIVLSGTYEEKDVVLAVSDNGEGLEAEQLEAVFNRFYRSDKSRSRDTGGTGLGLAIVSAIVASHGGSVAAWSDGPGHGCTFSIALPVG